MKKSAGLFILFVALLWIPAMAQKKVQLTGSITELKQGKEMPLQGATVIVGTNISIVPSGISDVIRNSKGIAVQVTTNTRGAFAAQLPAGKYTIILWKQRYVPSTYKNVAAPGVFKGRISYDSKAGASGSHMNLIKK